MLLLQGSTPNVPFFLLTGTTPTGYTLAKSDGSVVFGSGTINNPFPQIYSIALAAGELNLIGPCLIVVATTNPATNIEIRADVGLLDLSNGNNLGAGYLDIPVSSAGGGLTLATTFDGAATVGELFKVIAAVLAGTVQTSGPQALFRNWAGTKNRVQATLAPGGNRVLVSFDFT